MQSIANRDSTSTEPEGLGRKPHFMMPDNFSSFSQPLSFRRVDDTGGVVLDSLEQVREALLAYEKGKIEGASATQDRLISDAGAENPAAGGLIAMFNKVAYDPEKAPVTELIMSQLKAGGDKHDVLGYLAAVCYDYWPPSQNFFKTGVYVEQVDNKYVLTISQAYRGSDVCEDLAKMMHSFTQLHDSAVVLTYSLVDGPWFNVDLAPIARAIGIPESELDASATNGEGRDGRPLIEIAERGLSFRKTTPEGDVWFTFRVASHSWKFKLPDCIDKNDDTSYFRASKSQVSGLDMDNNGSPQQIQIKVAVSNLYSDIFREKEKQKLDTNPERCALLREEMETFLSNFEKETGVKLREEKISLR